MDRPPPSALALTLIVIFLFSAAAATENPILSELSSLQSQSPNGVIHLSDDLRRRILTVDSPRPFHALIFFDAEQLHSKTDLSLAPRKSEFSLLSKSFYANNPDKKSRIFFFAVEFRESKATFDLFGVSSLPHILLIPSSAGDPKSESVKVPSAYSKLADKMAEFIRSNTDLSVGPVHRPPLLSKTQIGFVAVAFLVWAKYFVRKLISGETLFHDKRVWMAGALLVYFFSISGAMFGVIRKTPMFHADRNDPSKLAFFHHGSGMQLGAEGFTVGLLYTAVGLLIAVVTEVLVKTERRNLQTAAMIAAMFVSVFAVKKVMFLDNWKTGYAPHGYWPTIFGFD